MTKNYWKIVNQVIEKSDILLLVLDARMAYETRNQEIEDKVKKAKKKIIYVITKTDLVKREELNKIKLKPIAFVSAKNHQGTMKLRERIMIEEKKFYGEKELFTIGVVGYPNVGKSSLINAIKGKKSAKTSSTSGYTKAMQKIRTGKKLLFYDTPGVIPYKEDNKTKQTIIGSIDYNQTKEPDIIAMEIMKEYPEIIEKEYGIKITEDLEKAIEEIAFKKKLLKKGNEPDIIRTARMILKNWQERKF